MPYKQKGIDFGNGRVDLRKKSGFGPRAAKGSDDQSKELAKSKYEMGKYKIDPTETDAERERREDAAGVGTNIKMPKAMKDGAKNKKVQDPKYFDLEKYDDDRG